MFGSLFGIATDLVKIAVAPIVVAADVTRAVTKPIADEVESAVKTIQKDLKG
jgi:hypothetical protein